MGQSPRQVTTILTQGVSIPSNTAEGAERDSKAEFIRFLHIAKGSAAELRTQVYIARQIGVVDPTSGGVQNASPMDMCFEFTTETQRKT